MNDEAIDGKLKLGLVAQLCAKQNLYMITLRLSRNFQVSFNLFYSS